VDKEQRALPPELRLAEGYLQHLRAESRSAGGGAALRGGIREEGWDAPMKEQMALRTGYAAAVGGMRPVWMVRHEAEDGGGGTAA
jgi:hypothetical protein